MPIRHNSGSIFDSTAQVYVNPVNCVGVSGAGLALDFKNRFPTQFLAYRTACENKVITPGSIMWSPVHSSLTLRYIAHFATKDHWRDPSKLEWIQLGLRRLTKWAIEQSLQSIAIPAIGCGLGGLEWSVVRQAIVEETKHFTGLLELFGPR